MENKMNKKTTSALQKAICLLPVLMFAGTAAAQNFDAVFKIGGTNTGYEYSNAVAHDNAGNTIAGGNFQYTCDFDPGPGTTALTEAGNSDAFIASYSSTGSLNWAIQLGGTNSEFVEDIDTDASGNIYATGYFRGTVDFDPGSGTTSLTSNGAGYDWFVLKLNSSGAFQWATSYGYNANNEFPKALKVSGTNVYVVGYDMPLTAKRPVFCLFSAANGSSLMSGICSGFEGEMQDVGVDASGNIYVTGSFSGTMDFDFGPAVSNLTSTGQYDVFVARYSPAPNVNLTWVKKIGGTYYEYGYGLDVNGNNLVISGTYYASFDADPDAGVVTLPGGGVYSGFTSLFDANGNFVWAKALSAANTADYCQPNSVKMDPLASVIYVGGAFSGTVDFDPGSGTQNQASAGTNPDGFLVKLDMTGNWTETHTVSGSNTDQRLNDIAVVSASELYAVGEFAGNFCNFDPGNSNFMLNSSGGYDVFVISYKNCTPSSVSFTDSICTGSSYVFGSQVLSSAGTYTDTLVAVSGCDSIITLTLLVNAPDVTTTVNGNTITANGSGTYQWINCATMQPVAGQTGSSFTPVVNGSYAVIVTTNGCSDTSACVPIVGLAMQENNTPAAPVVYPNPAGALLNLQTAAPATEIAITDLAGATVRYFDAGNAHTRQLDISALAPGIYFLRITYADGYGIVRFTKQ